MHQKPTHIVDYFQKLIEQDILLGAQRLGIESRNIYDLAFIRSKDESLAKKHVALLHWAVQHDEKVGDPLPKQRPFKNST